MKSKLCGYDEWEYLFAGKNGAFHTGYGVSHKRANFHTPDRGLVITATKDQRMSLQYEVAYFTGYGVNVDIYGRWIGISRNSL